MTLPDEIERAALLGWCIYPGSSRTRHGCFKGAHEAATYDLATLAGWAKDYPDCSWRLVCGPSWVWGLDLDTPPIHANDGIAAFKEFLADKPPLPSRPTMRSGGGGLAIFFKWSGEPIIGDAKKWLLGVDPRRGRQSQTIPPSLHHVTRKPYRWLVAPWDVSPPVAPSWLLKPLQPAPAPAVKAPAKLTEGDRKRNYAIAALHAGVKVVASAGDGSRNITLNSECWRLARFLHDGTLTESEIRDCMLAAARASSLEMREAIATIDSAIQSRRH